MSSAHCSTSGPTGMMEQPETGRSWGSALPVLEPITLLSTTEILSTLQRAVWTFTTDSFPATGNYITANFL
jgi:hypothetical protein